MLSIVVIHLITISKMLSHKYTHSYIFILFRSFCFTSHFWRRGGGFWGLNLGVLYHWATFLVPRPHPLFLKHGLTVLLRLAYNLQSSCLSFVSSWDYSHVPPHPAPKHFCPHYLSRSIHKTLGDHLLFMSSSFSRRGY